MVLPPELGWLSAAVSHWAMGTPLPYTSYPNKNLEITIANNECLTKSLAIDGEEIRGGSSQTHETSSNILKILNSFKWRLEN